MGLKLKIGLPPKRFCFRVGRIRIAEGKSELSLLFIISGRYGQFSLLAVVMFYIFPANTE